MRHPEAQDVAHVVAQLQKLLALHGQVETLRVYVAQGVDRLYSHVRQVLVDNGWTLVDCTSPNGPCTDTLLALDALQLAFTSLRTTTGSSLCLVSNTANAAHVLRHVREAGCRTMAVTDITNSSFLAQCQVVIGWSSQVLLGRRRDKQSEIITTSPSVPPGFDELSSLAVLDDTLLETPTKPNFDRVIARPYAALESSPSTERSEPTRSQPDFDLPADLELIWTAVEAHSPRHDKLCALKSMVGCTLKMAQPVRFLDREALRTFMKTAVTRGLVGESGHGADKQLFVPTHVDLKLEPHLPCARNVVPTVGPDVHFLAFVHDSQPDFATVPGSTNLGKAQEWHILGFGQKVKVILATQKFPWLRDAILVHWDDTPEQGPWVQAPPSKVLTSSYVNYSGSMMNQQPPHKNLYVSGYGEGTTTKEMEQIFSKHCTVLNVVSYHKNRYMFVNTWNVASATKAMRALDGTIVNGGYIKVKYSKQ